MSAKVEVYIQLPVQKIKRQKSKSVFSQLANLQHKNQTNYRHMLSSPPDVDMMNLTEQQQCQLKMLEYLYKKLYTVCIKYKFCLFVTKKLIDCLKIVRQGLLV